MLCQFQVYSKRNRLYIDMYPLLEQLILEKVASQGLKGQRFIFQGDVYFYFSFPIGPDSLLFFHPSLLVYNLSVKGQTLALFPPDSKEEKNKGTTWTRRGPGRPSVNQEMCNLHLFTLYMVLNSSRSSRTLVWQTLGHIKRTSMWFSIWLTTSPGLCFALLPETCSGLQTNTSGHVGIGRYDGVQELGET